MTFIPSKPKRTFVVHTEPTLADPAHFIRISELYNVGGNKVSIDFAGTWRVRLLCWLISRWVPVATEERLGIALKMRALSQTYLSN